MTTNFESAEISYERRKVGRAFLTKNSILTINHFLCSLDLTPGNFYLFGKLHLAMKVKRHAGIEDIQRLTTVILNIISPDGLKMSFDSPLDRAKRCTQSKGDYLK